MKLPESVKKLIDELSELPSIGPRQARRLAFYLIARGEGAIQALADATRDLTRVKICSRCFFIHQNSGALCDTCGDVRRKQNVIAIVEKETDVLSIENTGKFSGRYLILGEVPKTGVLEGWQKLRLQSMKSFIEKDLGGQAEEIILALNPTSNGDFYARLISKELSTLAKKMSRLGRGLPVGGEIEFADEETLGSALEKRS